MLKGKRKLILQLVFGAILLSATSFTVGFAVERAILMANDRQVIVPEGTAANFQEIVNAWNTIQRNYVDRASIDKTRLTDGAIRGMVDALGDTGHSRFLQSGLESNSYSLTSGPLVGIGVDLVQSNGQVVIQAIYTGSPAQKAGLSAGDILLKVDGSDTAGLPVAKIALNLSGIAGTKVQLTLQDPQTGQQRTLSLARAPLSTESVTWQMLPGTRIAQVYISAFSAGVTDDLQKALTAIKAQGARGLILDLRNNPGGLVLEAVGVTSQFLQNGIVVQEVDADGFNNRIPVQDGGLATDIPLAVLINQGTASAAEIVSGALQDAGRARLVGETTFGTGTMLTSFPLHDHSAILLATQIWLTPKGRTLWHTGIVPDEPVTLPADTLALFPDLSHPLGQADYQATQDTQLLAAVKFLSSTLPPN